MQKFQNSKLMVQSYCLAEVSNKEASKPIFKNSWVNRFVESRLARIMHGNQNLTIHGQSIWLGEVCTKNAEIPKFKINGSIVLFSRG